MGNKKSNETKPECQHESAIVRRGDCELPEVVTDHCVKCNHRFTKAERESIKLDGSYCESDYSRLINDPELTIGLVFYIYRGLPLISRVALGMRLSYFFSLKSASRMLPSSPCLF